MRFEWIEKTWWWKNFGGFSIYIIGMLVVIIYLFVVYIIRIWGV